MKLNTRYILNPNDRLRNDGKKCVIYSIDDFFHTVSNVTILSSHEALLISLFDGIKPLQEVINLYFDLIGQATDNSIQCNSILHALENIRIRMNNHLFLIEAHQVSDNKRKAIVQANPPEKFIIPYDKEQSCQINYRLSAPLFVNFNVTTTCDFHCIYCYHPLIPIFDYLPLERFKIIVKQLKEAGCESIMLTGGDPFQRPDFIEIVKLLQEQEMNYSISTKSILNESTIERLCKECGMKSIQLSLDSDKQEILTYLTGCKEDYLFEFEKMVNNLHFYEVEVRIKTVLTSYNIVQMETFLPYLYDQLCIKNIQLVKYKRSGPRHTDKLFPSDLQFNKANIILAEFRKNHHDCIISSDDFEKTFTDPVVPEDFCKNDFFKKRIICTAGRYSMTILPNGEVTVCEQLPYDVRFILGNLAKENLQEVWNGPLMKKWLEAPPRIAFPKESSCFSCEEEKYKPCHEIYSRCLKNIFITSGNIYEPDTNCPNSTFKGWRIS